MRQAHEGHVGYRVDQFDDPLVDSIIKKKPNLILIKYESLPDSYRPLRSKMLTSR